LPYIQYASVCATVQYLKRIQPMSNVPLAYVSVFQRMSDIFIRWHTLVRYAQWRSQGPSFGGGRDTNAEGARHFRGVRGHAPPENFEI
jgi:hypothetical protein